MNRGRPLASVFLLTCLAFVSGGCQGRGGAKALVTLNSPVITEAVVWSGEVRINGVATVKKEGRLTILPGTRVVFSKIDLDGDGIGDGELLVEGELLARGTEGAPIVFTSGAANPQKADWKYLYLDFARRAELSRVVSEYAYSGIQIHFCQARIVDSIFRYNVDGVRFSTVKLELAGNRIHDNSYGLRYEERGSTAHIHHNEIRDNEIGIFVVTRGDDKAVIEGNNIVGSLAYSVKLGLEQQGDVTLPGNWWGSSDPEAVASTFFDRRFDRSLGTVRAPEPLAAPVPIETWHLHQGDQL